MSEYKLVPVELLKDWHERINTIAVETAFNVADEMESILYTTPQPTNCVGCEGRPEPENTPCAVCGLHLVPRPEPAMQGEPVAWYLPGEGGCDSQFRDHATVKSCTGNPWAGWQPLYARPQPAPDVSALVEALERIAAWPDGGNQYGQANIKIFAAEALATYRNQEGEA